MVECGISSKHSTINKAVEWHALFKAARKAKKKAKKKQVPSQLQSKLWIMLGAL